MPLQCNFAWRLGVCLDALQSQSNVMIIYVRGTLVDRESFAERLPVSHVQNPDIIT